MKVRYIKGNRNFGYKILQWQITQGCNYRCSYCIVDAPNKNLLFCRNYEDIIDFLNKTLPLCDFRTVPRLWGGEPTIHPDIDKILRLFKIPFGIYTNMSQSIEFYKNCIELAPLLQYWYCSLHYCAISDIDEYISKMDTLYKYKRDNKIVSVHLNIMLEKEDRLKTLIPILITRYGDIFRVRVKVLDKIDYGNDYYFDNYSKFLSEDQRYQYNGKIISRFDIVKSKINYNFDSIVTENRVVCDVNRFFNRLDMNGNFYTCMDDRTKICSIYNSPQYYLQQCNKTVLCQNKMCCPYLFEYGTKKALM